MEKHEEKWYKPCILEGLAHWVNEHPSSEPGSWFCRVYDSNDDLIGETSPQALLLALVRGQHQMDMLQHDGGGSAPVSITDIGRVWLYVG